MADFLFSRLSLSLSFLSWSFLVSLVWSSVDFLRSFLFLPECATDFGDIEEFVEDEGDNEERPDMEEEEEDNETWDIVDATGGDDGNVAAPALVEFRPNPATSVETGE